MSKRVIEFHKYSKSSKNRVLAVMKMDSDTDSSTDDEHASLYNTLEDAVSTRSQGENVINPEDPGVQEEHQCNGSLNDMDLDDRPNVPMTGMYIVFLFHRVDYFLAIFLFRARVCS